MLENWPIDNARQFSIDYHEYLEIGCKVMPINECNWSYGPFNIKHEWKMILYVG